MAIHKLPGNPSESGEEPKLSLQKNHTQKKGGEVDDGLDHSRDKISQLIAKADNDNALTQSAGLKHVEYKDGLPIISAEDFTRMYHTDIRALGTQGAATFNFQGYFRDTRPGYINGTFYRDVLATNGILKGNGHNGIHVGTDGIIGYEGAVENHRMKNPKEVGKYIIYIDVPTALQRELNVVVSNGSCISALSRPPNEVEEIYESQEKLAKETRDTASSIMVIPLDFDPKQDKSARKKTVLIHTKIIQFIESGKPLYMLADMVENFEDDLKNISEDDFERAQFRFNS
jgi:hypothetical protein